MPPMSTSIGGAGEACPVCDWDLDKKCTWGGDCICRRVGVTCFSDFGAAWYVIMSGILVVHLYFLRNSIILTASLLAEKRAKKQGLFPMVPIDRVTIMSLFASCLRVAFCISRVKGVGHNNSIFGDVADANLAPLGEIIWLAAMLYLVLVWKSLIDQAQTMKKSNPADMISMKRKVYGLVVFLLAILLPIGIVGTLLDNQSIKNGCVFVFILVGMYMAFVGQRFSSGLIKLLEGSSNSGNLISTIKFSIRAITFGFACIVLANVVVLVIPRKNPWIAVINLVVIYGIGEPAFIFGINWTKLKGHKSWAKVKGQKSKVLAAGQVDTVISTTSKNKISPSDTVPSDASLVSTTSQVEEVFEHAKKEKPGLAK